MKKAISVSAYVLCILTVLFTVGILILNFLGYDIRILNISAAPFVCTMILIFAVCVSFLSVKHGKSLLLKAFILVFAVLTVCVIGFFMFVSLVFGGIVQNTVVKTVESPNEKYYAEVIDNDQGALGGATLVNVNEKYIINTPIVSVRKKPKQVYHGKWGEYKGMKIYWKNDTCLVIDAVEYEIE